jgi:hypothetical protein
LSERKAKLDKLSGVTDWVIHDLRRTARSLMSRAGVDAILPNGAWATSLVAFGGVYDRHSFLEEKRMAFEKLAALIEGIVSPQDNVVPMTKR